MKVISTKSFGNSDSGSLREVKFSKYDNNTYSIHGFVEGELLTKIVLSDATANSFADFVMDCTVSYSPNVVRSSVTELPTYSEDCNEDF